MASPRSTLGAHLRRYNLARHVEVSCYNRSISPDLRRHWMDGLTAAGRFDEIRMDVIGQATSKAEADTLEQDRIAYYLARGCDLVNTNHNPRGRDLDRALKAGWKAAQKKD